MAKSGTLIVVLYHSSLKKLLQGKLPTNARSCKHLKSLLGEEYEAARLQLKNPHAPSSKTKVGKEKSSKRKNSKEDDDGPARKLPKSNSAVDGGQNDDEAEEDDADEPPARGKSVPKLLLANKWDLGDELDPTGWWVSEKLDGVRYATTGNSSGSILEDVSQSFLRRKASDKSTWKPIRATSVVFKQFVHRDQTFTDVSILSWPEFPKDITLDGELFGGRGKFQSTVSIVKTINSPHWKEITFQVRDTSFSLSSAAGHITRRSLTYRPMVINHLKIVLSC
jgi:DNA ligase 1